MMKNEKIVKVCKIVVEVCNIAVIIAQTLISAFENSKRLGDSSKPGYTQEDVQLIKDFLQQEKSL